MNEQGQQLAGLSEKDKEMMGITETAQADFAPENQEPEKWTAIPRPELYQRTREQLKSELKDNREGVNTARVESFLQSQGIEVKEYIIFDEEEEKKALELLRKNGLDVELYETNIGWYHYKLDLVFIKKDKIDPLSTESSLVHELTHAALSSGFFQKGDEVSFGTEGFNNLQNSENGSGVVVEEGVAELMAGRYREENLTPSYTRRVLSKYSRFIDMLPNDKMTFVNSENGKNYHVAAKYAKANAAGDLEWGEPAFAGQAFELLCQKNPELLPALIRSRKSVDGAQGVAARINNISPGLYAKLSRLSYGECTEALSITQDALDGTP